jgi:Secretion system C-terminal sorting domain
MKLWLKSLWLSSALFCAINCAAQLSLVEDGSFEDTTAIWQGWTGQNCTNAWFNLGGNVNYNEWTLASTLRKSLSIRLPNASFVQTPPHTGFCSPMLSVWDTLVVSGQDVHYRRSFPRSKLKQKLVQGKQYCATLYVTAGDGNYYPYCNALGMNFDDGSLDSIVAALNDSSGQYTFVKPQVPCPFIINDTAAFMKMQGTFIANGTEQYITIGNFMHKDSITYQPCINSSTGLCYKGFMVILDDVSVIPVDIKNWLPDSYAAIGADSVWVGLDSFDYSLGKWYTQSMQYIATGSGFWYKSSELAGTQFIQEIEVCGISKYDTCTVYVVPAGIGQKAKHTFAANIFPNPSNNGFSISVANSNSAKVYINILDLLGNELYAKELMLHNNLAKVAINLPSGNYIVKISNSENETVVKKFVAE